MGKKGTVGCKHRHAKFLFALKAVVKRSLRYGDIFNDRIDTRRQISVSVSTARPERISSWRVSVNARSTFGGLPRRGFCATTVSLLII
jgi:hypothetical protein